MKLKYISLGIILLLSIFLAAVTLNNKLLHLIKMKTTQQEVEDIKNLHNSLSVGRFCKKDWWRTCRCGECNASWS